MKVYDLFIVGGGINGTGIARDAAGRGLEVALCEKDDLGAHTSSASTKLIHGGLRYLENREFGLVRKSLREREVLLHAAPHIIWPLAFVLPHHRGLRPSWLLRLGLWIYDRLGGRSSLPRSRRVALDRPPYADQLKAGFRHGFRYHDCWVEDSRLVVLNAVDAAARGADIRTRTRCVDVKRSTDLWTVTLERDDGARESVAARMLVNAAGPWAGQMHEHITGRESSEPSAPVRLIQGSHVVVPRLYSGDHAYLFQSSDGRVVFAIPYEHRYTLIGTTEKTLDHPPDSVAIDDDEAQYLCVLAGEHFVQPVRTDDIVWSYSGVRALFDDRAESASRVTRDYVLKTDGRGAPALSVFGGKITTYRQLAEDAMNRLAHFADLPGRPWTGRAALPGGDFALDEFDRRLAELTERYAFVEPATVQRLFRAYGTRIHQAVNHAGHPEDLGDHFGGGLFQAEVDYLLEAEFAKTGEDILWRRSKLGLHLGRQQRQAVCEYCRRRSGDNHLSGRRQSA